MNNNRLINDITELIDKANKFDEIMKELDTTSNTTLDKVKDLRDKRVKDLGFDPKELKDEIKRLKQHYEDKFYDFNNWSESAESYLSDAKSEIRAMADEYFDEHEFADIEEILDAVWDTIGFPCNSDVPWFHPKANRLTLK